MSWNELFATLARVRAEVAEAKRLGITVEQLRRIRDEF